MNSVILIVYAAVYVLDKAVLLEILWERERGAPNFTERESSCHRDCYGARTRGYQ
jgi:hypothetical protein